MSVTLEEQETVIRFDRNSKECIIYTSDSTQITRLDKLYRCVKEYKNEGEISAKQYVINKKFISFRTDPAANVTYTPKGTPEQRQKSALRLQEYRKRKQEA